MPREGRRSSGARRLDRRACPLSTAQARVRSQPPSRRRRNRKSLPLPPHCWRCASVQNIPSKTGLSQNRTSSADPFPQCLRRLVARLRSSPFFLEAAARLQGRSRFVRPSLENVQGWRELHQFQLVVGNWKRPEAQRWIVEPIPATGLRREYAPSLRSCRESRTHLGLRPKTKLWLLQSDLPEPACWIS